LSYLNKMGIVTVYASPIFEAVQGSAHGYDTINPHEINPEIGSRRELERISDLLKQKGMGWIQDIVPNHMAFDASNNWLTDVLKKGEDSFFKKFFDLEYVDPEFFEGKPMVPFLGTSLDEAIENGDLKLVYKSNELFLTYGDQHWPVNDNGKQTVFKSATQDIESKRLIREIVDEQFYRLCSWEETDQRINYRRFFTVNGLICLNMQRKKVFT